MTNAPHQLARSIDITDQAVRHSVPVRPGLERLRTVPSRHDRGLTHPDPRSLPSTSLAKDAPFRVVNTPALATGEMYYPAARRLCCPAGEGVMHSSRNLIPKFTEFVFRLGSNGGTRAILLAVQLSGHGLLTDFERVEAIQPSWISGQRSEFIATCTSRRGLAR